MLPTVRRSFCMYGGPLYSTHWCKDIPVCRSQHTGAFNVPVQWCCRPEFVQI